MNAFLSKLSAHSKDTPLPLALKGKKRKRGGLRGVYEVFSAGKEGKCTWLAECASQHHSLRTKVCREGRKGRKKDELATTILRESGSLPEKKA
jgi:hypothetical protein